MAKYAYAPVSVDKKGRRPHEEASERERDDMVNQRMPMCVGVCVLLAIVYVLSRSNAVPMEEGGIRTGSMKSPVPAVVYQEEPAKASVVHAIYPQEEASVVHAIYPQEEPAKANVVHESGVAKANTLYPREEPAKANVVHNIYPLEEPAHPEEQAVSAPQTAFQAPIAAEVAPAAVQAVPCEACACDDPEKVDMGAIRETLLSRSPPHIIECAAASGGDSGACHLPAETRYEALKQKGATLWMTGCSGAGKTTIATELEDALVKLYGKSTYRLDGDNLRTGLNRDLGFSAADRAESVRRTGELATLFSDSGIITLVGLISPYRKDRDLVRKRHEDQGIPFYEIFLDVPVEELKKRDPKGQYARVESGELKHFTCIDDPYEEPLNPEITLRTHQMTIKQSAEILFHRLQTDGILHGAPKLTPPGLPNPDGDEIVDLHAPLELKEELKKEAESLVKVLLTDIDINWLQTIGEGWVSPLKGFMREGTLLQTLHFNRILTDPFNLTNNMNIHETQTDFNDFQPRPPPVEVSMSIPITLSITDFTKANIEAQKAQAVALVTRTGKTLAILRNPEIYANRKEEIITRMFGGVDLGHPYIKNIIAGGEFLMGGEVTLLDRITYNDGLDKWRKTAKELMEEFEQKGADTVYAFQTRNPTHAGHAYLMKSAGEDLKSKGYSNPVLWLSPLGGWTKSDDVPLDVRIQQHERVLEAGTSHPGGLDPRTTVMAIWPSPMVYAGPTEVEFHAKSRRSAGASYFVVGRDPAGIKRTDLEDTDFYHGDHGRYVLQYSPGLGGMKLLSFVKVMYDVTDNTMKTPDPNRLDDFISISGTKMRLLARNGAVPCAPDDIPTDLVEANCVPSGFMVPKGWEKVVHYYKNIDQGEQWVPWSQPREQPLVDPATSFSGQFGFNSFHLTHNKYASLWHDVPITPNAASFDIINFITEIPMFVAAKMELNKESANNPIMQDHNKDGSPRFYTYGVPFFNYGFVPQTWEDPSVVSSQGHKGDNDPLDVMEVGTAQLPMGSIHSCRVLGSLELIDEGETDHKILCIHDGDALADKVRDISDLERYRPGYVAQLVRWLKNYKTSDGKPQNVLAREEPTSSEEAVAIVRETHARWELLCEKGRAEVEPPQAFSLYGAAVSTAETRSSGDEHGFWLESPGCRS